MIKAILFDMDGVLIDAKEWHFEALNKALDLFGLKINRYDHLVTFDGLPTKKKLEMLSLENKLPQKLHKFINDLKQAYTKEIIFLNCKPTFVHQFALSKLKQEGYKLAVCSNSVKDSIELMMTKSNLIKYIDFYLSNQDVIKSKPDPEIYIKAYEKFNLKPEECLIIEDNDNGIKAAIASGCHLMHVESVNDVNYFNISNRIKEINNEFNNTIS